MYVMLWLQDGATALHLAAWNGRPSTVQLLLQKGADVNVSNHVSFYLHSMCSGTSRTIHC